MYLKNTHTLGLQSHKRCDKGGNYVSLSTSKKQCWEHVPVHPDGGVGLALVLAAALAQPGPLVPALKRSEKGLRRTYNREGAAQECAWPFSQVPLFGFHGNPC